MLLISQSLNFKPGIMNTVCMKLHKTSELNKGGLSARKATSTKNSKKSPKKIQLCRKLWPTMSENPGRIMYEGGRGLSA